MRPLTKSEFLRMIGAATTYPHLTVAHGTDIAAITHKAAAAMGLGVMDLSKITFAKYNL